MLTRSKRRALAAALPETEARPPKRAEKSNKDKDLRNQIDELKEQIDTLQHEKAGIQMALEDAMKPKKSRLLYIFRSRSIDWSKSDPKVVSPVAYRSKDDAGQFIKEHLGIELKFGPCPPQAVLELRNLATHAVLPGFKGPVPQAGETYYMIRAYKDEEGTVYFGHYETFGATQPELTWYPRGVQMAGLHVYYRLQDVEYIKKNLPADVKADIFELEVA